MGTARISGRLQSTATKCEKPLGLAITTSASHMAVKTCTALFGPERHVTFKLAAGACTRDAWPTA
jgi:hypothetical protein